MKEHQESAVDKLWRIFSSMKLGLVLLGVIAFFAGIGTLFPQMDVDPDKAQAVGKLWQTLGFTNLYGTYWFRLLLGLLCINLIICSIQRFQGIYNRTFKLNPPENSSVIPKKVQETWQGDGESLRKSVQDVLRHRGFRVVFAEKDKQWGFTAIKRRWGNWGSFISHVSFVVLVIGAVIGSSLGFKGFLMAGTGTTVPIHSIQVSRGTVKETFDVLINSAEDRMLANGQRDNWYTDLSILQNGKVMARHTISVNHPFTYQGVTFYQSSFINGVHLTADVKGQKIPVTLEDRGGNYFNAPGTDLYLVASAINSDSQKPSMLFEVFKGMSEDAVQSGQLDFGQTIDIQGAYKLTLDGNSGYTGLQVKQDPGVMIIWLGCALLLLGLILSFYWRPILVSGIFQAEKDNRGELTMGVSTGKVVGGVKEVFDRLVGEIRAN
ncbi:ResB protein required for cytochrome c biosynthesis [Desulfosporosinus acidiphilus SJ4]|uniref:ResB protein required for cytochrome c biosynthesis n=1 Tax=Desulfosporosinus acidiphilus (strain DSM 22704 / JCM 16185 / SJ4) TaxID=646529 RepID=I4D530_DESAJ|nr:cytochrome c biogenesis protein ResB [Desulfosporosinus acidiphilus]AFM40904.1 ResB protein required for cytochrome c biosynthesis [Desulfosporosinus acidiphilus SJ4]